MLQKLNCHIELFVETIDIDKCFQGEIELANTGDILEFIDENESKICYGIIVKNVKMSVLMYNEKNNVIELFEFSYAVNNLSLQKV